MWQQLFNALSTNGIQLITLGGSINPYVGGVVALIVAGLLVFFGIKAAAAAWANQVASSGGSIGGEVGGDQNVATNVADNGSGFLGTGVQGSPTGVQGITGLQVHEPTAVMDPCDNGENFLRAKPKKRKKGKGKKK